MSLKTKVHFMLHVWLAVGGGECLLCLAETVSHAGLRLAM